ncbi:MAG: ferritin-like protein [Gemmatimonadetes bacterium]|nr:ferritin-like protein [Gemmatimonadota bacterium]
MSLDSLDDLYLEELKDLYSAENQIIKALPKMIKAATNPELQQAFADHLEQTKEQVARLVRICEDLGASPKGKKCSGMEGILEEGSDLMSEDADDAVLDAGLASAAQHVEHYEIAGYGSVRTWAEQLGHDEHVILLQQTLDEEKMADELLTKIATTALNIDAEEGDDEEEPAPVDKPRSRAMAKSGRAGSRAQA